MKVGERGRKRWNVLLMPVNLGWRALRNACKKCSSSLRHIGSNPTYHHGDLIIDIYRASSAALRRVPTNWSCDLRWLPYNSYWLHFATGTFRPHKMHSEISMDCHWPRARRHKSAINEFQYPEYLIMDPHSVCSFFFNEIKVTLLPIAMKELLGLFTPDFALFLSKTVLCS